MRPGWVVWMGLLTNIWYLVYVSFGFDMEGIRWLSPFDTCTHGR